ncbi:MAG: AAA family ATPase [Planctomycetota bacterium]|nr:AAA family ATPase [Planctomycetota bacterium]
MTVRLLQLGISNFRGIKDATIDLSGNVALIGPNGAGKSTIIDALCLAFGRQKLVPVLTEHDFHGSSPTPRDRFLIVATIGGFEDNDAGRHPDWFRQARGVPKWWNPKSKSISPTSSSPEDVLCVQIGLAARFDHDQLEVEIRRYFHDSDKIVDPFDDDAIVSVPTPLLNDVGFYLLPARRTWEAAASFGSELFRRTVAGSDAFPASSVIAQRDELRSPALRPEDDAKLKNLSERINAQLAQLMPGNPKFQLRVTSTDSDSLLRALVPHYARDDQPSLPASRQGTGLLALQAFVILLEVGRARRQKGRSFILALEEPELHVAPGLQRRIVSCTQSNADQVLCTTHSPEVAAAFRAEDVRILRAAPGRLEAVPLLSTNSITARNTERRLAQDFRAQVVDALMHDVVLVPEGRIDHEWLRLLAAISQGGGVAAGATSQAADAPQFATFVGTIPTPDAAIKDGCEFLLRLHHRVVALVDGDTAGDGYISVLTALPCPPSAVLQWSPDWTIEDVVGWIASADESDVLKGVSERTGQPAHASAAKLVDALKRADRSPGALKGNYLAYQDIAAAIAESARSSARARQLLDAVARAARGPVSNDPHVETQKQSTPKCAVLRVLHEPRAV